MALRALLGKEDAGEYGFDADGCPLSFFERLPPSLFDVIEVCLREVVLGFGVMCIGLFMAYFGAGIRTVLVAGNAFILIGVPLLTPILGKMAGEVKSLDDFTPEFLTALLAAFISAMNASLVVLKVSDTARSMLQGFTTGMLFSGFAMGFWLPLLDDIDPPLEDKMISWIKTGGAVVPGLFLASAAAIPAIRPVVWSLSFAIIGGFLFIGVISNWIGGGYISLVALATGDFGACSEYGYYSMGILGFVILTGMAVSLKKVKPPGFIGMLFCLLFMLEDYLKAMNDPEEKQRQQDAKAKAKKDKGGDGGGGEKKDGDSPDLEKMFGAPATADGGKDDEWI